MPRFSTWSIRLALAYLFVGFTLGALMLAHKGIYLLPGVMELLAVHQELLLIGWVIHLVMGVAYWMFPRFTPEKTGLRPRGFVRAAWMALGMLNLGLVLFVLGETLFDAGWLVLVGRGMETLAVAAFLVNLWPRVKPVSKPG